MALCSLAIINQPSKRFGTVGQRTEVDRAVRIVLRTKKVVATCGIFNREAELTISKIAAGKRLGAFDMHIAIRLIRVGERKGYGVGLRRIGSAHIGSRRFATGYRGGYREFASVGNGYLDSYRVDSAIVGITRLTSVNLGNLIGVGLARIALGEHHVVTQNLLQHLFAVGARRHCELIAALSQTEHIGRFRVGGRYRNLELTFDHITAIQDLRQLDAAIGGVIDACRVAVHKRAVFSRSRSGEFAFAVINNRYRNSGLVGCVINVSNSARGFGNFVLKRLGRSALQHFGSVGDVAETEVLGIRLGYSCGCHAINRSIRHGRTIGKRLQVEGEAIGIQPIPALQDLLQLGVRSVERNILGTILVHEGNQAGILFIVYRGCCTQLALAVIGDGDFHRVVGTIVVETCVLNEPVFRCCIPLSTCRDILLHGKFVSLTHIIQGKGMACKLGHLIGHAGSAVVFVLEALVGISQQSLGIIVLTLDGETKLACLHGATIQGLGNLDARKRHGAVVLVDERYAVLRVSLLGLQRTIVSVGHNNRYSFRAAVEGQAVRAVFGQRIAIPLGLIHVELVGTGLGKGDFAEAEVHWIIARGIRNRSRIGRNSYRTCLYRTLRSIVCSGKLEPKGFAIFHVTAGQSLGASNCCRCGCGVIAICELEGSPLRNVTFQVLGTQHQHIIVVLKGYLDGPNRRVVLHAC